MENTLNQTNGEVSDKPEKKPRRNIQTENRTPKTKSGFIFRKVYITTLANAGVMIKYKKTKILIDALQSAKNSPYPIEDESTLNDIITGNGIFAGVDIMMFTHEHPDHFNPNMCIKALNQNPQLQIVGPKKVIDYIKRSPDFEEDFLPRLWPMQAAKSSGVELYIRNVNITTIGFSHDTHEKDCEINNAYLINIAGKNILHVGDAQCNIEEFENAECLKRQIHAMFVPFTYVGSKDGRQIITNCKPQKLFINHLPDIQKDPNRWNEKAKMAHEQHSEELPPTIFADIKAQEYII